MWKCPCDPNEDVVAALELLNLSSVNCSNLRMSSVRVSPGWHQKNAHVVHCFLNASMGFNESKFEKELSSADIPEGEHYVGLENFGNTCYCNSVLQALYYCLPLRKEILRYHSEVPLLMDYEKENPNSLPPNANLLTALCDLFYLISTQKKRTGIIGPKQFIATLKRENELFRGLMQQDAQEFLIYLLNEIAELLQKAKKNEQGHQEQQSQGDQTEIGEDTTREEKRSIPQNHKKSINDSNSNGGSTLIHHMFEGILTNETRCMTCETVTSKDESFLDLSLDIEQNTSITHCLKNFSSTETLSGEDKFYCESCHSKQEAQKRIKIKKAPNVLILHLKRFKFIEQVGRFSKLTHRVVFPFDLRLDITTDDAEYAERQYDLFAIVIHIGSGPNLGHYVSVIKSCDKWLLFDDDNIELIDEEGIRFRSFGSSNETQVRRTGCGYLLFYQARDAKPHLNDKMRGMTKGSMLNGQILEQDTYCM